MASEKPIILLDIDGVVANLVGSLLEELALHGHYRVESDVKHYEFARCFTPEEMRIAVEAMKRSGFADSLGGYPGAQTFIDSLHKLGDVVAVTKPYPASRTWARDREDWCSRFGVGKVIHTSHKQYVAGDVLIEDHPGNLSTWLHHNPGTIGVLLSRPWNDLDMGWYTGDSFAANATSYGDVLDTIRELWAATPDRTALARTVRP